MTLETPTPSSPHQSEAGRTQSSVKTAFVETERYWTQDKIEFATLARERAEPNRSLVHYKIKMLREATIFSITDKEAHYFDSSENYRKANKQWKVFRI